MIRFDIARKSKKAQTGIINSLNADCKFIHTGCSMPTKVIPGVPNDEGKISFINNGTADTCMLIIQIKGDNYLLWEGLLDTNERLDGDITITLPVEDYPESETIHIDFYCGYKVDVDAMVPTDEIGFDIYVQVKKTDWVTIAVIAVAAIGGISIIGSFLGKNRRTGA